jgi:hypothetical protein
MAGAGAVVVAPELPGVAAAVAPGGTPDQFIDRNFVAGRVARVDNATVTVVDPDGGLRPMALTSTSQVWKRGKVGASALEVGDGLYARGVTNPSGVLEVDSAWVEIVNFSGIVAQAGAQMLTVTLDRGMGSAAAVVSPGGATLHTAAGVRAIDSLEALAGGEHVQVIGYCADSPSAVMATRIFVSAAAVAGTSDEASSPSSPPQSAGPLSSGSVCAYSYQRLATWQCCGGVNACGSGAFSGCNPPPGERR